MERIEINDTSSNASNFQLDDGRIYRIHLNLLTPHDQLSTADFLEVETRGYQVNKSGAFVVDDNGEPIMLPTQRARIPTGNIRNGSDTAKPGWIRQPVPEDEAGKAAALEGSKKLKALPKTGTPGDKVVVNDELYAYSEGLYDSVRRGRLAAITPVTDAPQPLDPATVSSLVP